MRSIRFLASAIALWFVVVSHVQAGEPDVRGIPPFVMLVVDSSGSMEGLPACTCASPTDCTNCDPNCDLLNDSSGEPPKDSSGHERKKNRWAVTLEALTGKFNDFQCTKIVRDGAVGSSYDEPYSIPYHQPWKCASGTKCPYPGTTSQKENGILDSYRESLRFGLMTFDGEATWRGGSELINLSDFTSNETANRGMQGMWSLGENRPFKYPGCAQTYVVNSGARSKDATEGALVSIVSDSCPDHDCDMYELNTTIQDMLVKTRPYGGTPIAASLHDLYYHLKDDVVDPYATCRDRYAILITDGEPDPDKREFLCDCGDESTTPCPDGDNGSSYSCPYPLAKDAAKLLVSGGGDATKPAELKKLFVLGMSVSDVDAAAELDKIAYAGGTTKALQADDPNTLRATLDNVFSPLLNPLSRSVPAFATGITGTPYQISTGFQVSATPLSSVAPPWIGLIERRRFVCDADNKLVSPTLEDKDRLNKQINAQTRRRLLETALPATPDSSKIAGPLVRGTGSLEYCGTTYCNLFELSDSAVTPALLGVPTTGRSAVIDWMYGKTGSARENRRLGDIYHASAAVVGPPPDESGDDAYLRFRDRPEVKERPLMMYVPSNDGILHAISVEDFPVSAYPLTVHAADEPLKAGDELWGFVPPMLLSRLNDQLSSHRYNFDGTPVIKDVYYQRGASAQDTDYHTVLITGLRGGGNGYIAMDITDPYKKQFLWQFTDSEMGLTYAQPEIVQATFKWPADGTGTIQTRAVAILAGGKGKPGVAATSPGCTFTTTLTQRKSGQQYKSWRDEKATGHAVTDHRSAVPCWEKTGRALYFVDVETGKLIKKVFDNDTTLSNGIFFPSPIVGTPTAYQNSIGTIATKGFVMDADGVLWRIDMSSTDVQKDKPSEGWTLRPFHDLFWDKAVGTGVQETTYERPILSLDESRRLVVIVGTGDPDDFEKRTADNRIVSLTEVSALETPAAPDDYEALINWELRNDATGKGLVPSEMISGSMALFQGQLFAATFVSDVGTTDSCEVGRGRMWSLDFTQHGYANSVGGTDLQTYSPLRIPIVTAVADKGSDAELFNTTVALARRNLLIQGVGTTQRMTCTPPEVDPLRSYFAPNLANIVQTEAPAIWVVAQASSGAKLGGSQLGSVGAGLERATRFSRVTSWATSID